MKYVSSKPSDPLAFSESDREKDQSSVVLGENLTWLRRAT